jgi:hypothetical protein
MYLEALPSDCFRLQRWKMSGYRTGEMPRNGKKDTFPGEIFSILISSLSSCLARLFGYAVLLPLRGLPV